jgi:hypothetical protein
VIEEHAHRLAAHGGSAEATWGPASFRYESDDPGHVAWFADHWHTTEDHPWPPGRRAFRLLETADPPLLEEIRRGLGERPARVEAFVGSHYLRGTVGGVACWVSAEGHGDNAHAIATRDGSTWLLVDGDAAVARRNASRVARELVRREVGLLGALPLHASAADPGWGGVAFLGPAGAGKTTLALHAGRGRGRLLNGDQTDVCAIGGRPVAVGLPIVARVGIGTLAALGAVDAVVAATLRREQDAILDGAVARGADAYGSDLKVELTPAELERLLGVGVTPSAELAALALVEREPGLRAPAVARVALDDAADTIRGEVRHPDPSWRDDWLALAPDDALRREPPTDELLRRMLGGVPVLRVRWDPARHAAADVLGALYPLVAGAPSLTR